MSDAMTFAGLTNLATHLRQELENKKFILLYGYNGTGKTRLSTVFKDLGKVESTAAEGETEQGDTLYFNAFTEDLFSWDNDLENDSERKLKLNTASRLFAGIESMEMDSRIRTLLDRYADFEFRIDTANSDVVFARELRVKMNGTDGDTVDGPGAGEAVDQYETRREEAIKISRGEENMFIWCFFLAIVELALDDDGTGPYNWVKHIYIDDPISSLDEHNAIAVANHLAQLLKRPESQIKTVISTHHALFFNVLYNELRNAKKYFLSHDRSSEGLLLRETGETPFFHHVAALAELHEVERNGRLCTHHFNMLRAILEKTASFHGYKNFAACIKRDANDEDGVLHARLINILSHGNYSLFEPQEMLEENKRHFRKILQQFIKQYHFNPALFPNEPEGETSDAT